MNLKLKRDLAKKALFLLENGYQRYCCLAIEQAADSFFLSPPPTLVINTIKNDFRQFYEEHWLQRDGYHFWGAMPDELVQQDRIHCMRLWIDNLEKS